MKKIVKSKNVWLKILNDLQIIYKVMHTEKVKTFDIAFVKSWNHNVYIAY